MTEQIFISYSKKDSMFAHKLADDLEAAGFKIWIDRAIGGGDEWRKTIERNIDIAGEVIVVVSPDALKSEWVPYETSRAIGAGKQIYPILYKSVHSLPPWLDIYQYIDFTNTPHETAFNALVSVLTPPNPIQDLLDQQVNAYRQTESLIGFGMLQGIEEARATLQIDAAAEELIQKSNQAIRAEQAKELEQEQKLEKTRRQRSMVLTTGLIIALVLSIISFSFYLQSNKNLESANVANTQVVAKSNAAETAQAEAEQQKSLAEERALRAQSGQLAAIASSKLEGDFNLAVLLSVESIGKDVNFLSRSGLLKVVQYNSNLLRSLNRHTAYVSSVVFSPDGKILASGSGDYTIRLWNVKTGQQIGSSLTGHTGGVDSVVFSPNGKMLASGSYDGTIRLWNIETGQQIGDALSGPAVDITSVAFSPDGRMLASVSSDGTVYLWDVETGQQIGEALAGHIANAGNSVAFSPDGKILASQSLDNIHLWNVNPSVKTGRRIGEAQETHTSMAFSPDGKTLSSGSADGTIRMWNVETGQQIGEPLRGHTDVVISVVFSPDGKTLASGDWNGIIDFWDVQTGQQLGEALKGHPGPVYSLSYSPDGKMLASGGGDGTIRLWNVSAVLNTNFETGLQVGEVLRANIHSVTDVAFSPDGKILASGGNDSMPHLWDVETGQQIEADLVGHTDSAFSVAFSRNGKILASGSRDETIRLWNVETGQQIGDALTGLKWGVSSVAFSPDGKILASGGGDRAIRLWNVETGHQIREVLIADKTGLNCVAFSPDGKILASGGYDGTIRLGKTLRGTQVLSIA